MIRKFLPLLALGASAAAQTATVPAHAMGAIVAEARETFGNISAIRPLSDGRLIVNDIGRRRPLLLDSNLVVEGEGCSVSFLLVPDHGGVELLLSRLGL